MTTKAEAPARPAPMRAPAPKEAATAATATATATAKKPKRPPVTVLPDAPPLELAPLGDDDPIAMAEARRAMAHQATLPPARDPVLPGAVPIKAEPLKAETDEHPRKRYGETGWKPEATLDPDLRALDDRDDPYERRARRVTPPARRRPTDVGVLYRGRRTGSQQEPVIDVTVPDTDNERRASEIIAVAEPGHPHQPFTEDGAPLVTRGRARGQVMSHENYHVSGQSYHFVLGHTTPVEQEDAWFFLGDEQDGYLYPNSAAEVWLFERADLLDDPATLAVRAPSARPPRALAAAGPR